MTGCNVKDCSNKHFAAGFCRTHHRHWKQGKNVGAEPTLKQYAGSCTVIGCDDKSGWVVKGMCQKHYTRHIRHGDVNKTREVTGWTGVDDYGYILLYPGHPDNPYDKRVRQHRIVMERIIGRALLPDETVHHKNGVRDDNRPENLELWSSRHPKGQRIEDKVEWAKEILALYGNLV